MHTHLDTAGGGRTSAADSGRRTDLLLTCGALAGPLFTVTVLTQALSREGFDLGHHPLSLLSLGDLGWVQVANFVVTGLLMTALAVGMRAAITTGPGRTWAPVLIGVHGVGLVLAGVFLPDPALGYPPGTPDAVPDDFSGHGMLHAVTPPLAFVALVLCCVVLARRWFSLRLYGRGAGTVGVAAAALTLSAWPGQQGASIRLAIAALVGFAWTTFTALDLRRHRGSR